MRDFLVRKAPREVHGRGTMATFFSLCGTNSAMGLGAGGTMRQEVYEDPWEPDDWDLDHPSRVWIHLCDAVRWLQITGELPPQKPITARNTRNTACHGLTTTGMTCWPSKAVRRWRNSKSVFALAPRRATPRSRRNSRQHPLRRRVGAPRTRSPRRRVGWQLNLVASACRGSSTAREQCRGGDTVFVPPCWVELRAMNTNQNGDTL